jgi:hypothetical protein
MVAKTFFMNCCAKVELFRVGQNYGLLMLQLLFQGMDQASFYAPVDDKAVERGEISRKTGCVKVLVYNPRLFLLAFKRASIKLTCY